MNRTSNVARALLVATLITATPTVASADDTAAGAQSKALVAAKAKAEKDMSAAGATFEKLKSKLDTAKSKAGFDAAKFESAVSAMQKADPSKIKETTDAFVKSWDPGLGAVLSNTGVDVKKEADALAAQLGAAILGSSSLSFGQPSTMQGTSSVNGSSTPVAGSAAPLAPTATKGLGSVAGANGLLHVMSMTHDPTGAVAQSAAGYATTVSAPKGTKRVKIEFAAEIPLALSLSTTAAGASASEAGLELRVIEKRPDGEKELCSEHRTVARTIVALVGVAPQIKIASKAMVGCVIVREKVDVDSTYTVVVQGVASSAVKGLGGSHTVLDAKLTTPTVWLEK